MLMSRSHACLAVLIAAASLACSDEAADPDSGGTNVDAGGSAGGGAFGGSAAGASAGQSGVAGKGAGSCVAWAGGAGAGGDNDGAGSGGIAGAGTSGSAGTGTSGGGGAGTSGGGGAAGFTCAVGADPEALLAIVGRPALLSDVIVAMTAEGHCALPHDGTAPITVVPDDASVALGGPSSIGDLMIATTSPGDRLAVWRKGMAKAHVTSLAVPSSLTGPSIEIIAVPTPDRKRAVLTFRRSEPAGSAIPVWLVGLEEGISDVLLGNDTTTMGPDVQPVAGGIVLRSFGSTGAVRSIANDGTVRTLCEFCSVASGLSPSSPWVPTTPEGSIEPLDPVVLRHAFTDETKWVGDAFVLALGARITPAGDALYATDHAEQLVRYDLATGTVVHGPAKATADYVRGGVSAISADGRTVQFGSSLVRFGLAGKLVVTKDFGPATWESRGELTLMPQGVLAFGVFRPSGGLQLRDSLLRIDPVEGTVRRVVGLSESGFPPRPWGEETLLSGQVDRVVELDLRSGLHRTLADGSLDEIVGRAPDGASYVRTRAVPQADGSSVTYLARAPLPTAGWESGPAPCAATLPGALLDNVFDWVRGSVGTGAEEQLIAVDQQVACVVPLDGGQPIALDGEDASLLPIGLGQAVVPLLSRRGELRFWKKGLTKARLASTRPDLSLPSGPRSVAIPDGSQVVFDEEDEKGNRTIAAYDFAKDTRTLLAGGERDFQASANAIVFREGGTAGSKGKALRALQADGTVKTLCDSCAEASVSMRSPWVLTSTNGPFGDYGNGPSQARLIHSVTGQVVDVSSKLRKAAASAFSEDGSALFTAGLDHGLVRYWLETGVVEKLGTLGPKRTDPGLPAILPSPDGAAVLFLAHTGDGYTGTVRLATGPTDVRDLGPIGYLTTTELFPDLSFTRDSDFAFFLAQDNGTRTTRVIPTAAGGVAKDVSLYSSQYFLPPARLSGSRVVSGGAGGPLVAMDVATGMSTVLVENGQFPYAIEGGTRVVYEAEDRALRVVAVP